MKKMLLVVLAAVMPVWMMGHSIAQVKGAPQQKEILKQPDLLKIEPLQVDPKADELKKLLTAQYNEALAELQKAYGRFSVADGSLSRMFEATPHWAQSGQELYDKPAERVIFLTQYLEWTKWLEALSDRSGTSPDEIHRAKYFRLNAEVQLLKAKREADKVKEK